MCDSVIVKNNTISEEIKTYNWFAEAGHPKTNRIFTAKRVSSKDNAIKIAIRKCYEYVTKDLNKRGYNDCFVKDVYDLSKNTKIASNKNNNLKETNMVVDWITKKDIENSNEKKVNKEEFKPKNLKNDTSPPVIKISKSITVSDSNYEIFGEVEDNSDKIFIEVDGTTILTKDGKFKISRFSPVNEKLEITAIDKWGNVSDPVLVEIIIDNKKQK